MTEMTLYVIRHKATGELMPQIRRGKGYSHWNPADSTRDYAFRRTGLPRFLRDEKQARTVIRLWCQLPNAQMRGYTSYNGEDDYDIDFKSDGRTKDDLEILPVHVRINS